ncbi:MAG TPA: transglutaminase domain-containing protein [Candidatus Dormibacteraeota bacterium]|nr:transglutaminase domain-containing protein [Candidatus Dormibacteraeota bacterium]
MSTDRHRLFRVAWWTSNALLAAFFVSLIYSAGWEYSVRQYLDGFSDAVVPETASPEQKVELILGWMRNGAPRTNAVNIANLSVRDPEDTLNYRQLLSVCGTATNAFLNLARSAGLQGRRLLLLDSDRTAKHVVAEVLLDNRWVIIDPTYRVIMRDERGQMLTRQELKDPQIFARAISAIPGYPSSYDYSSYAHVRIARLPMQGLGLRRALEWAYPGWDEAFDWSLLLERESFFVLVISGIGTLLFLLLRAFLGWYADRRLKIPRFHFREHLIRAAGTFFSTPEIER